MQGIAAFKKIDMEGRAKGCYFREDSRGGESKVLHLVKEIISECVRVKKKQKRFFFSHETYTRIIVIDLIIVKLFGVCLVVFFLSKKKGFSCKYLYYCVRLLFWIANICDNIIWDPTF